MKIEQAYNDVFMFNDVAGNLTNVTLESIAAQLDYIQEEYLETVEAFDEGIRVNLLDGVCDMFVTVAGLMQKMEAVGFDVKTALQRVNENNLSKYVPYDKPIRRKAEWTTESNDTYKVTVLKNENGKIMKPLDFTPVSLSDLVPESFFKENSIV